jgi:Mg2+/Co2+ transporter CorC
MVSILVMLLIAVVAMIVHRQAAGRMLVVDPDAQERGVLVIAEEARPALVVTEIVAISVVILLAGRLPAPGVVTGGVLAVVVLVTGLLVPTPVAGQRAGATPLIVGALARLGARSRETPPGAGVVTPVDDPLDEGLLTRRMLRFQEQEIDEVMVPRSDVVAIERREDVSRLLDLVEEHRHSRYPVFDGDIDHVVGYVNVFDLRRLEPGSPNLDEIVRTVLTVPEGKHCTELLDEMMTEGREFALVVDEFGGTAGIVTIEDLVEELVGEIWDEHEKEEVMLRRVGRSVYVSQATIPLAELSERLDLELPEGDYETLAGFLLEAFGRIPVRGETVTWGEVTFEVLRADRRRIEAVQVTFGGGGGHK